MIIRLETGRESEAIHALEQVGGIVRARLPIIGGLAAAVPQGQLGTILDVPGIVAATPDRSVHLLRESDDGENNGDGREHGHDGDGGASPLNDVAKQIGARALWKDGITGRGVDVALIDSGVVPVNGLTEQGKVINGPDLSFESQSSSVRWLDTFGHGTHMAGIIAGRDDSGDGFTGIAPGARILSLKVANAVGATDVSQVIAAIDWVVQHRTDNGLNIRVLNLSFGTDGTQDYVFDPLAFAVEVAWRKGIFVVVSAGNDGAGTIGLANPARDPFVLAVGADDTNGTQGIGDDAIPSWSSRGNGTRDPDLVAPGRSIVSLRDPGSFIDQQFPAARVGSRFFRGSGTSQAAAVMSGAAALMLQQHPSIRPDQLKALLTRTATPLRDASHALQGAGLVNLKEAARADVPNAVQSFIDGRGTGSLEAARGSAHVEQNDVVLSGEQDIFGTTWSGDEWAASAALGTTWSGGSWRGTSWSGECWCGTTWSGASWSGTTWSDECWCGTTWSAEALPGTTWSGTTWSGTTWSGTSWSGTTWSGTTWSGTTWSGTTWSSANWGSE